MNGEKIHRFLVGKHEEGDHLEESHVGEMIMLQEGQCACTVTLRLARESTVAVKKQQILHISVCVMGLSGCMCWRACSLIYPACNTHAPHRHLWPLVTPYYSLPHKRHDFRKKVIEHKTCFNFLYSFYVKVSRDSVVGIAIRLATGCKVRGSIPVGSRFSANIQTGSEAHPASCTMGTGSFPGVKAAGAWC